MINKTNKYVQAYIITRKIKKKVRSRLYPIRKFTFSDFKILRFSGQAVFLKKDKAFKYAQFSKQGTIILKAFIPESAIMGQLDGLTIKAGTVFRSNIQGFYPIVSNRQLFVKNERFVNAP